MSVQAGTEMAGILYLIPNTLSAPEGVTDELLASIIPAGVQRLTASLDYFIAENAKATRACLNLIARKHPLRVSLQEITISELNVNTPADALPDLLAPLLRGRDAGLISDAGVPAVADPGANLLRLAHRLGVTVRPLVGPSSLLLAVMASGLNGQSFAFNGYLPTDTSQRIRRLKALEERSRQEQQTQLFIETPYRNLVLLEALAANCSSTTLICIATDLTTQAEFICTQSAGAWKKELALGNAPDFHKRPTVFLFLAA